MEIRPEEIVKKELVGWAGACPVYAIGTSGGYQMIVVVRNGRVEPLGAAPHPAVAKHVARKREPSIIWNELAKSDDGVDPQGKAVLEADKITSQIRKSRGFGG